MIETTTGAAAPDPFAPLVLNPKQLEAQELIAGPAKVIGLIGPQRTGKTVAGADCLVYRAANIPNSRHIFFRRIAKDARRSIFDLTLKEVMQRQHPEIYAACRAGKNGASWNKQDAIVTLPNGSTIMVDGLDDDDRLARMMGMEYTTIYLNEVSEMDSFDIITRCLGRLSETRLTRLGTVARTKLILDCNPPYQGHWFHKLFALGIHPVDNLPLEDPDYWAHIHIGIEDNKDNLPPGYYEDLAKNLRGDERERLLYGRYPVNNPNALFRREWINKARRSTVDRNSLVRIIVAVDPAVTSTGDEHGIIVCGVDEKGEGYILADRSLKGTPSQWASAVADAYDEFEADYVVAEKNQGGEMVAHTIQGLLNEKKVIRSDIKVKMVHASRGKIVRADPVSHFYETLRVHHVGRFEKLEEQMIGFAVDMKRGPGKSPDRVDAMVWGLTELMSQEEISRGGETHKMSMARYSGLL